MNSGEGARGSGRAFLIVLAAAACVTSACGSADSPSQPGQSAVAEDTVAEGGCPWTQSEVEAAIGQPVFDVYHSSSGGCNFEVDTNGSDYGVVLYRDDGPTGQCTLLKSDMPPDWSRANIYPGDVYVSNWPPQATADVAHAASCNAPNFFDLAVSLQQIGAATPARDELLRLALDQ